MYVGALFFRGFKSLMTEFQCVVSAVFEDILHDVMCWFASRFSQRKKCFSHLSEFSIQFVVVFNNLSEHIALFRGRFPIQHSQTLI